MKRILLFVVIGLLLFSCNNSPEKRLENIVVELNKQPSVHYKLKETVIYLKTKDTLHTDYEVWLVRDRRDTALGGYARVDNTYRPYSLIYNMRGGMYIYYPTKKRLRYYAGVDKILINYGDFVYYFMHPMELISNENILVRDTNINGKEYLAVTMQIKRTNSTVETVCLFGGSQLLPEKSITHIKSSNPKEVILEFSDVRFEPVDTARFNKELDDYLSRYPLIKIDGESDDAFLKNMLAVGVKAPLFEGSYYRTGKPFRLADFIGKKIILVEFWYTHCPYCAMSIPYLAKLYDQYKDKDFVIFGVNSVDNKPGLTDVVLRFCRNRGMTYEAIRATQDVDVAYHVVGYPAIYIIDREGRIAYRDIGFSLKQYERLKRAVEQLVEE